MKLQPAKEEKQYINKLNYQLIDLLYKYKANEEVMVFLFTPYCTPLINET